MTDILLVTSELVTNAIRHGGASRASGPCAPRRAARDRPRRERRVPAVAPHADPASGAIGGYGWPLIRRLATEVTVTACPGGGKQISVLLAVA
ncbi:ATP-binding protein [Streptomyces sp. M19]